MRSARRPALVASGLNGPSATISSASLAKSPGPALAIAAMICWRPAWMASGSLLLPISRAISASLGSASVWARNAGSEISVGSGRKQGVDQRRVAVHRLSCLRVGSGGDEIRQSKVVQRLPAGKQVAVVPGDVSAIGGRLFEMQVDWRRRSRGSATRTGREVMPVEARRSACASTRCSTSAVTSAPVTPEVTLASEPSSSRSPMRSGICIGSLELWPGVGGTICSSDSVEVRFGGVIGASRR